MIDFSNVDRAARPPIRPARLMRRLGDEVVPFKKIGFCDQNLSRLQFSCRCGGWKMPGGSIWKAFDTA